MTYPFYYYFDWTYVLVLIGAAICGLASWKLKSTYNKYARVRSFSGMTGAEAAQRILNAAGIYDVQIYHIPGNLTDNYNPSKKTLNLSDSTYDSTSIAAVGVAAHECGHAIQHQVGYFPLNFRSAFVPVANIGSTLAWPVIIVGCLFTGRYSSSIGFTLIQFGILLFSFAVIFQLITLPVEFNASRRALKVLEEDGILQEEEIKHTRQVLVAAALTYVAGAAATILQLLRLILLFGGRRDD